MKSATVWGRLFVLASAALALAVAVFALNGRGPVDAKRDHVAEQRSAASVSETPSRVSPKPSAPVAYAPADDWAKKYYGAKDAFEFVSAAAPKALAGDAAAAYYVAQAVGKCFGRERDAWNAPDPEAALLAKWSAIPGQPYIVESDRKVMHACLRYVREDAFVALPARQGGYNSRDYWMKLAYDGGEPLAEIDHAARQIPGVAATATERDALRDVAQDDVERAVSSAGPEAIFRLGDVFNSPSVANTANQSSVFRLAACELGFDCSSANPALDMYLGCTTIGTCAPGYTIQDWIRDGLGAEQYAVVYAQAQQLADAVRSGDTAYLQKAVQFAKGARQLAQ
jgi:hypothetical protein